jgi:hypothetical protein
MENRTINKFKRDQAAWKLLTRISLLPLVNGSPFKIAGLF